MNFSGEFCLLEPDVGIEMADSFTLPDKVQESLQCPICFHCYDDPRNLPCQHTYCRGCIGKLVYASGLTCPLCNAGHNILQEDIDDLPRNFALCNVLDTLCEECKQRQRSTDCSFCEKGLCICCITEHETGHSSEAKASLENLEHQLLCLERATVQGKDEIGQRADRIKAEIQRAFHTCRKTLEDREQELINEVHSFVHQDSDSSWQKQLRQRLMVVRQFHTGAVGTLEENASGATSIPLCDLRSISDQGRCHWKELDDIKRTLPSGPRFVFTYSSQDILRPISSFGTLTAVQDTDESDLVPGPQRSLSIDYYPSLAPKYIIGKYIKSEHETDELKHPWGVASSSNGNLVVSDSENNKIYLFNNEELLLSFGGKGRGDGQFYRPRGVAVAPNGGIYVADSYNNRIEAFDSKGNFFLSFGRKGSGNGMVNQPMGLTFDGAGLLYICDSYNYRIQVFQEDGSFVRTFGSRGQGSHQFSSIPCHVAVQCGKVYVTDRTERVQIFNVDGDFIDSVDVKEGSQIDACTLAGVCVDPSGNIILANEHGQLLVMSEDGSSIRSMRNMVDVETKHLNCLKEVAFGYDGTMLVCDCNTRTVRAFQMTLHF